MKSEARSSQRRLVEVVLVCSLVALIASFLRSPAPLPPSPPERGGSYLLSTLAGFQASAPYIKLRKEEEKRLTDKAQDGMDAILPGKIRVVVVLDIDIPATIKNFASPEDAVPANGVVREGRVIKREQPDRGTVLCDFIVPGSKHESKHIYEVNCGPRHPKLPGLALIAVRVTLHVRDLSPKEEAAVVAFVVPALGLLVPERDTVTICSDLSCFD